MTLLRLTTVALFGLTLVACDEDAQGRSTPGAGAGGKADDASGAELDPEIQAQHLAAVGACERAATRDRAHTSALRFVERAEIEQDRVQCIGVANDAVRSALALSLQVTAPQLATDVGDAFTAWRSAHANLCSVLLDAHEHALEKSIAAVDAGCVAEAELRLAEAVEAFADLGGARATGPDVEARYGACFALYEAARDDLGPDGSSEIPEVVADAQVQAEVDAQLVMGDCIADQVAQDAVPQLASRVLESFPGREPSQVDDAIVAALEASAEALEAPCTVIGYAAGDGGPIGAAQCRVAAALWQHELIGYVVPQLAPASAPEQE